MHLVNARAGSGVPSLTDLTMFGSNLVRTSASGAFPGADETSLSRESNAADLGRFRAVILSGGEHPMSTHEANPSANVAPRRAGLPGLVAAVIIGVQAIGCAAFAIIFLVAAPEAASLSDVSHLMFSLFTVLFAIGLGLVARGLWQGLRWPRTATVVWLVLLLPSGWAMVQAGRGLVGALILGSAVMGIGAVTAEGRMASPT